MTSVWKLKILIHKKKIKNPMAPLFSALLICSFLEELFPNMSKAHLKLCSIHLPVFKPNQINSYDFLFSMMQKELDSAFKSSSTL